MKTGDQVRTNSKTSIKFEGEIVEVNPPKTKHDVTVAKVQTGKGFVRANVDYLERVED